MPGIITARRAVGCQGICYVRDVGAKRRRCGHVGLGTSGFKLPGL